jgi:DNA-binding winged helix-turn-helix (wHTH) protein/Tol biopolymer transport system component
MLMRQGKEVPLPPRVLALLECLVEGPGQVITRQELIERVWRDAFVTDTSLAEAISFLRQALGDDPQNPRFVQTIHRRGYRFVAPVEPEPPPEQAPLASAGHGPTGTEPGVEARPSIGGALVPWSLVVLLGATLVVAIWRLTHPAAAVQPHVARFELAPAANTTFDVSGNSLAVSPDGRQVAFSACSRGSCRLYLRELRGLAPQPIEGTVGAASPFFSPDSRAIGYFADGKLKRISTAGGTPIVLADAPDPLGGTWLADGRIVFAGHEAGGLEVVSENGGHPAVLTRVEPRGGELGHRLPRWMTGTDWVLFTASTAPSDPATDRAMALSLSTGRTVAVTGRAAAATLISEDILIFGRGTELDAARFDRARGVLAGVPLTIVRDVQVAHDGMPMFAASAEGTLLHVAGPSASPQIELVGASGGRSLGASLVPLRQPALDKDALRAAGVISDGLRPDLWVADIRRGTMTRLSNQYPAAAPAWNADGQSIVFSAAAEGAYNLWVAETSGPGLRRLVTSAAHQFPSAVSPGGDVVFTQIDGATRGDIWLRTKEGRVTPLVRTPFDEREAAISPDGRWLAYLSDESGLWQVYVKRLDGEARFVVSRGASSRPWWLEDGRLVYATADGALEEQLVHADGTAAPVARRDLAGATVLAVSPTGSVLLARYPQLTSPAVVTVQAWQEISRALPPGVTNLPR